jgi:hypothetical protein
MTSVDATGSVWVQTARPRDLGAVALIVGLFLILLIVAALAGQPGGL